MDTQVKENKSRINTKEFIQMCWFFYVVTPALILLTLLLILTCIEHTKYEVNKNDLMAPNVLFRATSIEALTAVETSGIETTTSVSSLKCQSEANCDLICTEKITTTLNDKLNKLQETCELGLKLILKNCFFPTDSLTPNSFSGTYNLKSLLLYCPLKHIEPKSFKQSTFANLTELKFYDANFMKMDAQTFEGLQNLQSFEFLNYETSIEFKNFLKPLAKTLTMLKIWLQSTLRDNEPQIWFEDAIFERLTMVDLSFNRFPRIVHEKTFEHLIAVTILNLNSCKIEIIEDSTFRPLATTLQYLNLRNNNLKQLDVGFLAEITTHSLMLELALNDWNCTCANEGLINAIQEQYIEYEETTKCKTPDELLDLDLKVVFLNCDSRTDYTEIETTSDDTTETTEEETTVPEYTNDSTELPTPTLPTTPTTTTSTTGNPTTNNTTTEYPTTGTTTKYPPTGTTTEYPTTGTTTEYPPETTQTEQTTGTATSTPGTTGPATTETVPWPPTPSPTPPPPITITCKKSDGSYYKAPPLDHQDAIFTIQSLNETSVEVTITELATKVPKKFDLIYFADLKNYFTKAIVVDVLLNNLTESTAYLFCLMPSKQTSISPFNCRSHYMYVLVEEDQRASWLTSHDKALFISLTALGAVVFIVTGGFAMYFTLRWRPIWLKGNNRIERTNPKSPKIMLHAKIVPKRVNFKSSLTKDRQLDVTDRNSETNMSEISSNYVHRSDERPHTSTHKRNEGRANQFSLDYEKVD